MGEVMELKGRASEERAEKLMPVVRKATEEDLEHIEEQERREKQALKICDEKIDDHGLPMKLIDASLSFDNTRLVFYFSADGRVDFRELVRDLAKTFRLRIELRQIGVRDEAKLLGGLGPCGRRLCCKTFMRDFEPVGIRVAKDQGLALNPNKISGLCDRLMCCLLFEHETYCELRDELPSRGDRVMTEHGPGTVKDVMMLKEKLEVHLDDGTELSLNACEVRPHQEKQEGGSPEGGGEQGRSGSSRNRKGSGGGTGSKDRKSSGDDGSGRKRRDDGTRTREKRRRKSGGKNTKRSSRSGSGRQRPRSQKGRERRDSRDGGTD
jgi:cell fate regulator YaaT (PSP1 superfamily)